MTDRILIFTGGNLGPWAIKEIKEGDFLFGVDRGALFLLRNRRQPDFVIGDFDSVTEDEMAEIKAACSSISCCDPVDKDYTDTEMAFNRALGRKPEEILLLGATGTRFDHTLANVHLLRKGLMAGVKCRIIDETNEISLTDGELTLRKGAFQYVSFLPLSLEVSGVTLEGFRYPLKDVTLSMGESLTVSNIQEAEAATIYVKKGLLLVIRSRD